MKQGVKSQYAAERSRRRTKTATLVILAIAIVLGIYMYVESIPPAPGTYDAFAKCIAQTGTKFYGAFWCPHCRNQKNEFGTAAQYLPYVECSLPDQSGQTPICIDKNIQTYPTWVFPDGSRLSGETPLATLAQKTGCALTASSTTPLVASTTPAAPNASPAY